MTRSQHDDLFAGPRVVVAPDKFKGSVSAAQAGGAISRGICRAVPSAHVLEHPIADGGEGTIDVLLDHGFSTVECEVTGPMGSSIQAVYALRDDTAVIEMASAAGLALVGPGGPSRGTATKASTYGVGELIHHAIDGGAGRVVVGVGGSATTDGGSGAIVALGGQIVAADGHAVPLGGSGLLSAVKLYLKSLDPRIHEVDLVVACDVDNPLIGSGGSATVYGPQKGAGPQQVDELEAALTRWSHVVSDAVGQDLSSLPGAGAAGGLAFGLSAVLGARIVSGVEFVLQLTHFDEVIRGADLIIVGEGSLDSQSLRGKGPIGLARMTRSAAVPVIAVTGRNSIDVGTARHAGLSHIYALSEIESDESRSMAEAEQLLELMGERVANDWLRPRAGGIGVPPKAWRHQL